MQAVNRATLAGITAGFLLAGRTLASALGFSQPTAGARLEAEAKVEVRWTLGWDTVAGFDESELLLSLDGGRTFPLRVTREVPLETSQLFWRVPALPTAHGRLALRAGLRTDADSESVRFVSDEFAIEVHSSSGLEELFRIGEEWRTREALESPAADRAASGGLLPENRQSLTRVAESFEIAGPRPMPACRGARFPANPTGLASPLPTHTPLRACSTSKAPFPKRE